MESAYRISLDQQRSLGGILDAAFGMYGRYPLLFAILALGVMAPFELAVLAITGYGPLRYGHENAAASLLVSLARTALITPLISALHMHAVVAIGDGRKPRLSAVARRGLQVLPVVAAADVMSGIGVFLGFIALIVPGVLLALRWAVVAQAAALEHEGWVAALGSSRRLTAGHYWHVFGLLVLTAAVSSLRFGVAWIPLGNSSGAASVAVGIAVDTILASFSALTLAVLYFDLRARAS